MDLTLLHFFNDNHTPFMDTVMTIATDGFTWIPLYIFLLVLVFRTDADAKMQSQDGSTGQSGNIAYHKARKVNSRLLIVICALMTVAVTAGVDELIVKPLVCRLRPTHDPVVMHTINIVNDIRGNGYSFFSAHAANTSGIALFLSLAMHRRWLTVCLVLWSLLNCYSRLYLGVHYPSDVLTGIAFGTATAMIVYTFVYKVCSANSVSRHAL